MDNIQHISERQKKNQDDWKYLWFYEEHDCGNYKKERICDELKEMLYEKIKPDYFITITFQRKLNEYDSDKELAYFLREMHKYIFGGNFYRKKLLFPIGVTRERNHADDRFHYHVVLNASKFNVEYEKMLDGFIYASRKSDAIRSIKDNERYLLSLDRRITLNRIKNDKNLLRNLFYNEFLHQIKNNRGTLDFPLSILKIEVLSEQKVISYITKDLKKNNFPIWIHNGITGTKNYFNIST